MAGVSQTFRGWKNRLFRCRITLLRAPGHRIAREEDFAPTLERAFTAGGVHLLDLPVDYSENGPELIYNIPKESAALGIK